MDYLNDSKTYDYDFINSLKFNRYIFNRGQIEFKNIRVKYPNSSQYALDSINLTIKSCEKLGICG